LITNVSPVTIAVCIALVEMLVLMLKEQVCCSVRYSWLQADLINMTWHEVQRKLLEAQKELQMCIHKAELT